MARTHAESSAYYRARSDEGLRLQTRAALFDIEQGVKGDEYYGHAPGTSWRLRKGADCLEMLTQEKERRSH